VGEIFTCTDGFAETLDLFKSKEVKKIFEVSQTK